MDVLMAPSILSADFADLKGAMAKLDGANFVHVDVMDNHFVPNLTIGLPVVKRIAAVSPLPLDVHLMIEDPDRWALGFARAGAASVTFHAEAAAGPVRLARKLRDAGVRAGIAVRPATPVEPILDVLGEFDTILVMTVEPGFGGQRLIEGTLAKIRRVREAISACDGEMWLQVDGGVSRKTIAQVAGAGANVFVAGQAVFGKPNKPLDPPTEIRALRALAEDALEDAFNGTPPTQPGPCDGGGQTVSD